MDQLLKLLKQRETELKKALVKTESDDIPSLEGHLRLAGRGNNVKYYHVTKPGDTRGSYIAKKDHRLAIALAQKEYHNKFLIKAKEELSLISSCYHRLSAGNADSLFLNMTPARQNLIMPYIITDGLFAKNWQYQSIKTNTFKEEEKVYDTRRGEKVRSKSEKILADIFYELEIPYFYEKALKLKHQVTRYPDFTLLNIKSRKEIYLEHFGLLDDEEYRINCLKKLDEYQQNGIYPGKNLLITYETKSNPLDLISIKKMIREIFEIS